MHPLYNVAPMWMFDISTDLVVKANGWVERYLMKNKEAFCKAAMRRGFSWTWRDDPDLLRQIKKYTASLTYADEYRAAMTDVLLNMNKCRRRTPRASFPPTVQDADLYLYMIYCLVCERLSDVHCPSTAIMDQIGGASCRERVSPYV